MSESPNTPMYVGDGPPEPFTQTWTKALTRPREETYAELAASPGASPSKAYLWIFLAGLVSYFLVFLVQSLVLGLGSGQSGDAGSALGGTLVTMICAVPLIAGFSVLGFMLGTAIIQWIAGLFGGQGNYSQMAYVLGAIAAPITLISGVVSALSVIPYIGILFGLISFAVGIYALVLQITAVKGVNRFGWGQAIGSVLLPGVVIGLACACVAVLAVMALGPMIGNVFSGIDPSLFP